MTYLSKGYETKVHSYMMPEGPQPTSAYMQAAMPMFAPEQSYQGRKAGKYDNPRGT